MHNLIRLRNPYKNEKGYVTIEFIFNLMIYMVIIIFLVQVSMYPLQILLLDSILRKAALVCLQIGHYSPKEVPGQSKTLSFLNTPHLIVDYDNKNPAEVIETYIKKSFPRKTLAGKIIDIDKVNLAFLPEDIINVGFLYKIQNYFDSQRVTITAVYPFTIFNIFNINTFFEGKSELMNIKRSIIFRINP